MSPISASASCQPQNLQIIPDSSAISSLPPHPVHSPLLALLRSLGFSLSHHYSIWASITSHLDHSNSPVSASFSPVSCFHLSCRLQPEGVSMMYIAYHSSVPIPPHFSLTLGFFSMAYKAFPDLALPITDS